MKNKRGEETRDSLLFFLEIHDKGATSKELATYINMDYKGVLLQLHKLEALGKVHSQPYDRSSKLWFAAPPQRLTPAASAARPLSRAPHRSR